MIELRVPELGEIAETLERGAEVVRQGWCQGTSWELGYEEDGDQVAIAFCASGALFEALGLRDPNAYKHPENLGRRLQYSLSLISLEGFLDVTDVPQWNDADGRTQDEVADAMERCAKELRNGTPTMDDVKRSNVISNYEAQQLILDRQKGLA